VSAPINQSEVYTDSCIHIEFERYYFACKGTALTLTKIEFQLLARLVRNLGQIVSVDRLWRSAWPNEKEMNLKSIQVFMSRLRRKLAPFGIRLDSVVSVGYVLSHESCCGKVVR
jgi:DNA-binding winged helix-turn-helix (wHTH) protein